MSHEILTEEHEQVILNVLHSYAWSYDSNDMDRLTATFADDGMTVGAIADSGSGWGPWQGAVEIGQKLGEIRNGQKDRRRHQLTTPIFLKLTDDEAVVKVYLSLFSTAAGAKPRLATTGEYLATFAKLSAQWKIRRLEAKLDGQF